MNENGNVPGQGTAVGSLVCGIVGVILCLSSLATLGVTGVPGLILGIIGMVLASSSKKAGFAGGLRTGGFVLSLLSVIFGAIGVVSCVACAGAIASIGMY